MAGRHDQPLHGLTVVVDTPGNRLYIGRYDFEDEEGVTLRDVDVRDLDDGVTKEAYLAKTAAYGVFKNQSQVRGRFVVGSGTRTGVGLAVPTQANAGQMFIGSPEVRTSYMVFDDAAEGLDEDINFLLDDAVLVFARKAQPSRRDPSFMKTFRLMNQFMVPGSYMRDDGRVEVAKFDWSEDVKVCNSSAAHRLNIATE